MSDLISRQAAIDALMAWEEDSVWDDECLIHRGEPGWVAPSDVIEQLPSAEPEIIRCKDYKNSEHWYRDMRRCFLWSEDGVSVFDDGFCNYAERKTDD